MRFKLIVAMAEEKWTDALMDAARDAGAKGSTVIHNGKGKGVDVAKTFLGLSLEIAIDIILLLVEEHQSRTILEALEKAGDMKEKGTGIAFQVDVEDAVGVSHQIRELVSMVEEQI
ncbi:MAG: P-II family nitrogen regulator [Chromatiaceae bacterium]|nr:P-II family nitrogen regulator [Gammaproteobacteria bacterium]MCP5446389.1 P-II family nitrogen regulator [Chromatiaceae bacterium]MCB1862713.1 P-II family nitrogen regulator [Gammaproteobacteria bacterium]MCB1872081.1 P-II family nitrogen regulator [Gammaproteobacteria bacterium]MCB1880438.1 P-II family nitrogen regulator [Gammaproteobacteria bacterium]